VASVAVKFVRKSLCAPLVIATFSCNAVAAVDVLAKVERETASGTPTPPSSIVTIVRRKLLDGVGVGANLDGSTIAATSTPSAFPPPPLAAAASNVDVSAKLVARVKSRTPTLPADGCWGTAVGVGAKFDSKTVVATSTPVRFRLSIAHFAMVARIDG
jgi:hypothetical protein